MDYEKMFNFWLKMFGLSIAIAVVVLFISSKQPDRSDGAFICGYILMGDVVFFFFSIIMGNVCNAKAKKMSAGEYMNDRFKNAIPETEELLGLNKPPKDPNPCGVTCPYCGSTDCKKISMLDRVFSIRFWGMASTKMGKQWHCNDCGSNF